MTPVDAGLIRLLLDHAEQMILLVEPDALQVVLANQVAQQRLGYSEDEVKTMEEQMAIGFVGMPRMPPRPAPGAAKEAPKQGMAGMLAQESAKK